MLCFFMFSVILQLMLETLQLHGETGWLSMQLFTDTGILNVLISVTKRAKFDFCQAHKFQSNVICEFMVFNLNIMEL